MTPGELRIGNIVDIGGLKAHKIKSITQDGIDVSEGEFGIWHLAEWGEVQPIKLTEEWLLKFGYSDENKNNFLGQFGLLKNIEGKYVLSYLDEHCLTRFNNIKIEYVHQLQNLYFALTGKELEMLS